MTAPLNPTSSSTTWIRTTTAQTGARTRRWITPRGLPTTKRTTWPRTPGTSGTGRTKGTGDPRSASCPWAAREQRSWGWWTISHLATFHLQLWRSTFTPRQQRSTTSWGRSSPRRSENLADVCSQTCFQGLHRGRGGAAFCRIFWD